MTGDPQPRHTESFAGEIPGQLTRLVGREQALSELRSVVWGTRLLTLCGPGGAGKTRLAASLGEAVSADFVGGSWWVDLSATLDEGLVAQVVAATLLADEPAFDPAPAAIARRFAESTLLVLDNCEQVVEAAAALVLSLLERAPSLRIVATSRQPLGVPGEQVWRVPGLAVEPGDGGGDAAATGLGGGVELFLERARAASSAFDPGAPGTLDSVRQICRRLDGMPLAIELAAARIPVLSAQHIAERIERDSGFLRHSSRNAPARHRTLPQMLDWSHRMLEEPEQRMFRRLAAFRGSFSLGAAEAVCSDGDLPEGDVLDLLAALVDRSLVHVTPLGEPRYRLLLTVRQYAAERLVQSGEQPALSERHARFFLALARGALSDYATAGGDAASATVVALEADNLRECLTWLLDNAPADAAELASLLWPYCYRHGYYAEARLWLERALAHEREIPDRVRAEALIRAGEVAFLQCDYGVAEDRLHRALALIGELGDSRAVATALQRLGTIAREQGRYDEARDLHERSLTIWHELGDDHGVALSQNFLGFVAWLAGDPLTAEKLCETALEVFQRRGDLQDAAATLVNLGVSAMLGGELALAAERLEEALRLSRSLGFQEGIAWSQHELAIVARRRRRAPEEAATMLREALLIHRRLGDRWRVASVLEGVAGAILARDDARHAAEVLAAAEALREGLGAPVPPAEAGDRDAALARVRGKLSATALQAAWSSGRSEELDGVIDRVTAAIDTVGERAAPAGGPRAVEALTQRELAVLELLAEGATNREIAAALYISPSTAGVHVSNLLRKLGAKRRVDAARIAARLGLLSGAPAAEKQR